MKTDKLFHEYFQLAPHVIFELLQMTPACSYQFESPVVKESERRLDGFLKPDDPTCPYYFIEFQGYYDPLIYWRMVAQIGLYHQQNRELDGKNWLAVALFLDKAHDPGVKTLGPLYPGRKRWLVRGVFSKLLKKVATPSPALNVLRPLAEDESVLRQEGARWTDEIRQASGVPIATKNQLLDLLVQFIAQRLVNLSRKEIESMLKLVPFEETRAGQEYIAEGRRLSIIDFLNARFGETPQSVIDKLNLIERQDVLKILVKHAALVDSLVKFEAILTDYIEHGQITDVKFARSNGAYLNGNNDNT